MNLLSAALVMFRERGWFCIPLGLDGMGLPKKPLSMSWTSLPSTEDSLKEQPWDRAKGLGIVLGATSQNLAVLDIDDEELFNVYVAMNLCPNWYRLVRTARKRGHAYFYELDGATHSTWREVMFRDRKVKIELKTTGTQVAAPPTHGYTLLYSEPPQPMSDIQEAFDFMLDCFEDYIPGQVKLVTEADSPEATAGYPRPWNPSVPKGERNQTLYIEAHKLREAGMPLDQATAVLQERFKQFYAPGDVGWNEVQATIASAYRKGVPQAKGGYGGVPI